MLLKCQPWQKVLLNTINAEASQGQHKPRPPRSINCCFSPPQAAIPKGSALTAWSRGLFFPLFFSLSTDFARRGAAKAGQQSRRCPSHLGSLHQVGNLRAGGVPQPELSFPPRKIRAVEAAELSRSGSGSYLPASTKKLAWLFLFYLLR